MNRNFSDPREPYARLRRAFVYKEKPSRTPLHLARHRAQPQCPEPSRPARHLAQAGAGVLCRTDRGSRHSGCGGSSCRKAITAAPAIPSSSRQPRAAPSILSHHAYDRAGVRLWQARWQHDAKTRKGPGHVAHHGVRVAAFGVEIGVGVVFRDAPQAVLLVPPGGPPRVEHPALIREVALRAALILRRTTAPEGVPGDPPGAVGQLGGGAAAGVTFPASFTGSVSATAPAAVATTPTPSPTITTTCIVPNVIGAGGAGSSTTAASVAPIINGAGLRAVEVFTKADPTGSVPQGQLWGETPSAGSHVTCGSVVTVYFQPQS